jgi:HEAT repeat protein
VRFVEFEYRMQRIEMEMDRTTKFAMLGAAMAIVLSGAGEAQASTPVDGLAAPAPVSLAQESGQSEEEAAYRRAREAVVSGQFERAAELFDRFRAQYPNTQFGADSYYWQAFALYRTEALREALLLLERQLAEHPDARMAADARELELRVRSMLGQRGDAQSAERALREAEMMLAIEMQETNLSASMVAAEQALARAEMVGAASTEHALERATSIDRARMAMAIAAVRAGSGPQEGCEGDDVRQAALQALMRMQTERAVPLLRGVLERRDECSVPLRKQAIFVLGQLDPNEVEDLMIEVARTDPDPGVQEAAVFWLSQVGSDGAVSALADILSSTDNPVLEENAIFALSQNGGDRAAAMLRAYALDRSRTERGREKAIFWLSQNPAQAGPEFLMQLYEELDDPRLKEHVFITLSQQDDPAAVDWVLARALDTTENVALRKQALFWAGQHSTIEMSRLQGLYEQLDDREMKEQLIFLYAHREEPERVDRLIEVIETEEDPELRKRAIFWLGQTGDERAIEFLLGLVGDPQ